MKIFIIVTEFVSDPAVQIILDLDPDSIIFSWSHAVFAAKDYYKQNYSMAGFRLFASLFLSDLLWQFVLVLPRLTIIWSQCSRSHAVYAGCTSAEDYFRQNNPMEWIGQVAIYSALSSCLVFNTDMGSWSTNASLEKPWIRIQKQKLFTYFFYCIWAMSQTPSLSLLGLQILLVLFLKLAINL